MLTKGRKVLKVLITILRIIGASALIYFGVVGLAVVAMWAMSFDQSIFIMVAKFFATCAALIAGIFIVGSFIIYTSPTYYGCLIETSNTHVNYDGDTEEDREMRK